MDNYINATSKTLSLLKIKFTSKYLRDTILSHPDYPSLLAISDTLTKYNIENAAIKIDKYKFDELPPPCIVQVSIKGTPLFYVLEKITNEAVSYFNHENKLELKSKKQFLEIWTGVCLLAEKSKNSKEVGIEKKIAEKRVLDILKSTAVILFISWAVITFLNSEIINTSQTVYAIIYTILKLIGLAVGIVLLWFSVDQYNPTLQSFCTGGGSKINCNAILNSKYAKLFNGFITLSTVGFSYFFGTLMYLLISKFSFDSIYILGMFSFMTLPAIIISVYYQAFIIKQWCKFCVIIQIVLVIEIIIAYTGNFYKTSIVFESLPLLFVLLLTPIVAWKLIKPLLEQEKETNVYKRGLKKIKNNPYVLDSLLLKSRKLIKSTKDLGILINNKHAKFNLIKVCNPYCDPCAKAHVALEELVYQEKINLQIIFTVSNDKKDYKAKPVRHFLAIDDQGDKKKIQNALDNWYKAEKKDYTLFASKYPMNGELNQQNKKIEAMRKWCDAEKITHTPTIFINGYELPKEYSVEDLKEVLQ